VFGSYDLYSAGIEGLWWTILCEVLATPRAKERGVVFCFFPCDVVPDGEEMVRDVAVGSAWDGTV
jgi:hypothetical protein